MAVTRLATPRAVLRPITQADFPQVEPWYASALALAHAERPLETRYADAKESGWELLAIVAKGDDRVVGILDYRLDQPAAGWLTTVYVAIADGLRGFGYGSEAVRALEASQRATSFLAEVDPRNGLGLYFWLRMGYRPANVYEVLWREPDEGGIIAMIRSEEPT